MSWLCNCCFAKSNFKVSEPYEKGTDFEIVQIKSLDVEKLPERPYSLILSDVPLKSPKPKSSFFGFRRKSRISTDPQTTSTNISMKSTNMSNYHETSSVLTVQNVESTMETGKSMAEIKRTKKRPVLIKPQEYFEFTPHALNAMCSFYETDDVLDEKENSLSSSSDEIVQKRRKSNLDSIKSYLDIGRSKNCVFRFVKSDNRLVKKLLQTYGFSQTAPNSKSYNLTWTSGNMKPQFMRHMTQNQRINHFPRTFELTRKDRLYCNIDRMERAHPGHYQFIPPFFVSPNEIEQLRKTIASAKTNGQPVVQYIVKPVRSSQGKGIFLTKRVGFLEWIKLFQSHEIPLNSKQLVCEYINRPLLLDNGQKFDIRLYVAVTSYDPLMCYLYSDGLVRFATEKYDSVHNDETSNSNTTHLTNYSVNKHSSSYVRNTELNSENIGHKWSFGALLRHLQGKGICTKLLCARIEDVIIKTLLSAQSSISAAHRANVPYADNCFELLGFDILLDEDMKPWLLEVNLSPSLSCDTPLDTKIKTSMLCDLLNMACIPLVDETPAEESQIPTGNDSKTQKFVKPHQRHAPAFYNNKLKQQTARAGGFICIHPTASSYLLYGLISDKLPHDYDRRLSELIFDRDLSVDYSDELITEVQTCLSDCTKFHTMDDCSNSVMKLLTEHSNRATEYATQKVYSAIVGKGCLPHIPTQLCRKTSSLVEYENIVQKLPRSRTQLEATDTVSVENMIARSESDFDDVHPPNCSK